MRMFVYFKMITCMMFITVIVSYAYKMQYQDKSKDLKDLCIVITLFYLSMHLNKVILFF